MTPTLAERLRPIVDHPLHRQLGLQVLDSAEGVGQLSLTLTPLCASPGGGLHGGVLYLLCDVCAMVGLLSQLPESVHAVTHDIQVSVMRSAALGQTVQLQSRVVRLGRRLAFCEVVASVQGETLGTAKITKSIVAPRV